MADGSDDFEFGGSCSSSEEEMDTDTPPQPQHLPAAPGATATNPPALPVSMVLGGQAAADEDDDDDDFMSEYMESLVAAAAAAATQGSPPSPGRRAEIPWVEHAGSLSHEEKQATV